jgi:aryl-alcohol dehydrogenase-like predicted oxidoreductase
MIGTDPATQRNVSVLSLGAMLFGSQTAESTSYDILDRYVEAGGTFVDTANNYAYWLTGTQGGESEALLGRWRRSRGIGDEIVIATKLGGRPLTKATSLTTNLEGLSADVVREQAERSQERLGVDRIDLYYAHIDDSKTPQEETAEAFAGLVKSGTVGLLGASNFWSWRLERARNLAASVGLPSYEVIQYHHTYLRRRTDIPSRHSVDGEVGIASSEILSLVRASGLPLVAYSPLLSGAYVRADRPFDRELDHPGTPKRMAALRAIAKETGATVNQVVLSWLIGGDLPVIPLVGASSVAQLNESLGAVDLDLSTDQRARLDAVN